MRKHARLIVANNARSAIGSDLNDAVLVTAASEESSGPVTKETLAHLIIGRIAADLKKEA